MSRIGKKPISVPAGVTVKLDGQTVSVKGPKGELSWTVSDEIVVKHEDGTTAEIASGVQPGERIAAQGAFSLLAPSGGGD